MKALILSSILLSHLVSCLKNQVQNITIKTCDIQYTQAHFETDGNLNLFTCSVKTCVKQQQLIVEPDITRAPLTKCYVNQYQTNYECFSRCCDTSFKSIQQCIMYQRNKGFYRTLEFFIFFVFWPCFCFTVSFLCGLLTCLIVSPFSTILYLKKKLRRTDIRDSQWVNLEVSEMGKFTDRQNQCLICFQQKCDSVLQCKHSYHLSCLKSWLKVRKSCPMCRQQEKMVVNYYCPKCLIQKYKFKNFQQVETISLIKDCPDCQQKSRKSQAQFNQNGQTTKLNNIDHFV